MPEQEVTPCVGQQSLSFYTQNANASKRRSNENLSQREINLPSLSTGGDPKLLMLVDRANQAFDSQDYGDNDESCYAGFQDELYAEYDGEDNAKGHGDDTGFLERHGGHGPPNPIPRASNMPPPLPKKQIKKLLSKVKKNQKSYKKPESDSYKMFKSPLPSKKQPGYKKPKTKGKKRGKQQSSGSHSYHYYGKDPNLENEIDSCSDHGLDPYHLDDPTHNHGYHDHGYPLKRRDSCLPHHGTVAHDGHFPHRDHRLEQPQRLLTMDEPRPRVTPVLQRRKPTKRLSHHDHGGMLRHNIETCPCLEKFREDPLCTCVTDTKPFESDSAEECVCVMQHQANMVKGGAELRRDGHAGWATQSSEYEYEVRKEEERDLQTRPLTHVFVGRHRFHRAPPIKHCFIRKVTDEERRRKNKSYDYIQILPDAKCQLDAQCDLNRGKSVCPITPLQFRCCEEDPEKQAFDPSLVKSMQQQKWMEYGTDCDVCDINPGISIPCRPLNAKQLGSKKCDCEME